MSGRRAAKSDMDDLDDVLGDLLGDDDDPPPKKTGGGFGRPKPGSGAKSVYDDDFYKNLAADITESDVSEADPNEYLKDDMDDMDAALFGGKKPVTPTRTSTPKSPSIGVNKPAAKPTPFQGKGLGDSFDDDPLADLLGDDDDFKPKKKPATPAAKPNLAKAITPTLPKDDDDSSQGSKRLEIERPPTRSGNNSQPKPGGRRKQAEVVFDDDDDDILGMMDSPPASKPKEAKPSSGGGGGGSSFLDSLMGRDSSVAKHLEKPGTGDSQREFVLDRKYTKSEPKQKELSEDDFQFGGYMPSAVNTAGSSRPSSKRSVRFEDDDDDRPMSRGSSGGRRRAGGAASFLEDMLEKDDTDWLDMAAGSSSKTEGKKEEKKEEKRETQEPVDWLGLSRLGSPADSGNRSADLDKPDETESKPRKSSLKSSVEKDEDDDDWLGLGASAKKMQTTRRAAPEKSKPAEIKDDVLGSKKSDDWLGGSEAKTDKADDWLGGSEAKSNKADDWLGGNESKSGPGRNKKGDDWLGESKDQKKVDDWLAQKDTSSKPAADDFLRLGAETDLGPSKSRADERGLDLFTAPARRDSGSLPWDERPRSGGRAGRRAAQKTPPRPGTASSIDSLVTEHLPPTLPTTPNVDGRGDDTFDDLDDTLRTLKQEREARNSITEPTAIPTIGSTPAPAPISGGFLGGDLGGLSDLQNQQAKMMQEQQKLMQQKQEDMRRQVAMQQEQMRKQQEQQMKAMQQQMQQQMQLMQTMPSVNMGGGSSLAMFGFEDPDSKMKKLELENLHLKSLQETLKAQHTEQISLIEDSYKKRIELLEETFSKRENRYQEENEHLSAQQLSKMKIFEQEKADLIAMYTRRQEDWNAQRSDELDRLSEQHRYAMQQARNEHEEALDRMKKAKELEVEAVSVTQSHSKSLAMVLEKISVSAQELEGLQSKVDSNHSHVLDTREMAAKARDEQLKALQERLERQHHDNEQERARLQGLIMKLETQLTDQTRNMEEERWQVTQERNRVQSLQTALEREKEALREQVNREREDIQRSKTELLEEQRAVLVQLQSERRALAQERAEFNVAQKLQIDHGHRESIKTIQSGAEVESSIRIINEERARLEKRAEELRKDREQLLAERGLMENERQGLHAERQRLEQVALQVKQRSQDIDDMCNEAVQAREVGEKALAEAHRLEADQGQRIQNIQGQLQILRNKEKQIAQERLVLAKEKKNLENLKDSFVCINCKTPTKDIVVQNGHGAPHEEGGPAGPKLSTAAASLYAALDPSLQSKITPLGQVSASIEADRMVRHWRRAAERDKEFLEGESVFLQTLQTTAYMGPAMT